MRHGDGHMSVGGNSRFWSVGGMHENVPQEIFRTVYVDIELQFYFLFAINVKTLACTAV